MAPGVARSALAPARGGLAMNRISRCALQVAGSLLLLTAAADGARADPPASAAAPAAGAAPGEVSEVKGGFLSTFTQAFKEDFDREVVRGHFDTGSASDTHRYYCLVDPKSGRNEPNAVSAQTVSRRDGTTGVRGVAVSPLSCADAEQKGLLITSGYVVPRAAASAKAGVSGSAVPPTPAQPATTPAALAAPPAAAAAAMVATPAVATAPAALAVPAAPAPPADNGAQWEIMAVYSRFIAGQNAHDRAAVAAVLLDSQDFVWTSYGGEAVWGYREAMEAFERQWQGIWKLEPQLKELRIASVAADTAVLVTPLLLTQGKAGADAATVTVSWGGVFIRTKNGWRLTSIFVTPLPGRHAPGGG
jgi:SnoaL-like protein